MKDNELRGLILQKYYERRREGWFQWKTEDFNDLPETVEFDAVDPKEGIIKYNLACYSCQTGDIEAAKNYLRKALEIDSSWRLNALNDEDLKPMWDSL